jgi:hypothetical protein
MVSRAHPLIRHLPTSKERSAARLSTLGVGSWKLADYYWPMAARRIDEEIARLYQLPLDAFTAARNALAKEAGPDAARVRRLAKPPLAAWAVNQLHWKQPKVYEELIASAQSLRTTHKAVLSGRKGDIRSADAAHDKALDRALKAALAMLSDAGHPATDATRQAIVQTLRALPADEPAGQLTRTLQPGGFEMLAGIEPSSGATRPAPARSKPAAPKRQESPKRSATDAEAVRRARQEKQRQEKEEKVAAKRAREAQVAGERALREAEHAARRGEFEVARAERDAERAQQHVADTRAALVEARKKVAAAKKELERLDATLPSTHSRA